MTIAAGFCYDGGILLCADSMYSGGNTKEHRSKIFPVEGIDDWGAAAFVLAGNEGYSKMAIQECSEAIRLLPIPRRSIRAVKDLLIDTVKWIYTEHIEQRPVYEQYEYQVDLLVAVWTRGEGLHLFATRKTAVIEIDTYECIGSAAALAQYLVAPSYEHRADRQQMIVLGIQAIAAAKDSDPNCEGNAEFLSVSQKGTVSSLFRFHTEVAENSVREFRKVTQQLLFVLTSPTTTAPDLEDDLKVFSQSVRVVRDSWILAIKDTDKSTEQMIREIQEQWAREESEPSRDS
jgi:20S proteasome alpha/beta subunit